MYSLRKWMFKPKKPDESLLAEFFYTDEELNAVAAELDSFDGRKDPERCSALVNKLRRCQDKVLCVIEKILQYVVPDKRASRDFRVKFPDDVLQDNLSGQLWFGAECLAAGSSIMNREVESASMRPLAKALTKQLDVLRSLLRDQCLRNQYTYSDKISEALVLFDKLFAEFELSYVSAMVPVKTMKEYDKLQEVMVLFCETVQRALKLGLLTQEMIDDYDPALMFTIPRLAIVCGLLVHPEGPINPDMDPMNMSEMFRPFQMLLYKIRELLWTLSDAELWLLEKSLSHSEDSFMFTSVALEEQLDRLNWFQLQSEYQKQVQAHNATAGVSGAAGHNIGVDDSNHSNRSLEDSSCSHGNSDVDLGSHNNSDVEASSHSNSDAEDSSHSNSEEEADNCDNSNTELISRGNSDTEACDHGNSSVDIGSYEAKSMKNDSHDHTDLKGDAIRGDEERSGSHDNSSIDELPEADRRLSVPHQDSGDSGMISMSDHVSASSAKITDDSTCHVPRLYWSRSWPPRSTSSAGQSEFHRHSVCCDHPKYIRNTELLQTEYRDSSSRRSREFVFHLPYNTSSNDSTIDGAGEKPQTTDPLDGSVESKNAQETSKEADESCVGVSDFNLVDSEENPPGERVNNSQIIYTLNGRETRPPDCQNPAPDSATTSSQIAFITGALNQFFFTDPEFEGVTPPRTPSTSSGSSASCGRVEHASKCDDQRPKHQGSSSHGQSSLCNGGTKRDSSSEPVSDSTGCNPHSTENGGKSWTCPGLNRSGCCATDHGCSVCSGDCDCDKESYTNSDTSSYASDINDDEEIALAIQAAEIAARQEARARFRNSSELIHKLFVCISGVADQLQTNYAGDLRHILKAVFQCNSTYVDDETHSIHEKCSSNSDISSPNQGLHRADTDSDSNHSNTDSDSNHDVSLGNQQTGNVQNQESDAGVTVANPDCPPHWVPDDQSPSCTSCKVPFTFVRRRHHCRNCGKIFCSRCSSNSVPLPRYGHDKPVRVCNHCFIYQVTPFTVSD